MYLKRPLEGWRECLCSARRMISQCVSVDKGTNFPEKVQHHVLSPEMALWLSESESTQASKSTQTLVDAHHTREAGVQTDSVYTEQQSQGNIDAFTLHCIARFLRFGGLI